MSYCFLCSLDKKMLAIFSKGFYVALPLLIYAGIFYG